MVDSEAGVQYRCRRCGKEFKSETWLEKHEAKCNAPVFYPEVEGEKWVACRICGHKGVRLGKHLKSTHGIATKQYLERFPDALTSALAETQKMSEACNWIDRAKENGDNLSDYKQRMSVAVSQSIMSNPKERARRSAQLAANNRTSEAREKSRNAAKKTSARPEIQRVRTERLARWRNANFDEFYEKCVQAAHNVWRSKPELALAELLAGVEGYDFRLNQVIKSDRMTNKSKRKQVDVGDKRLRFYVEFDGIIHFEPRVKGEETYKKIIEHDKILDDHIKSHGWTLVRISYDQYDYKDSGTFSQPALEALFSLLKNPKPGVYCIGQAYSERNLLNHDMETHRHNS